MKSIKIPVKANNYKFFEKKLNNLIPLMNLKHFLIQEIFI